MNWTGKAGAWALAVVLIFAGGMATGWKVWGPKAPKVEAYAPEIHQKDGSVVLERKPQADAKPAQELPKGAKLERVVQVTVQPRGEPAAETPRTDGTAPPAAGPQQTNPPGGNLTPCPPVRVDLSLIRMPDQSRRVVASSPDGDVVGGVDIPVEAAAAPRVFKWAAGGSWNPSDKTYGAWIQRNVGFLVVGLDVSQQRIPAPAERMTWDARIRAGIRF